MSQIIELAKGLLDPAIAQMEQRWKESGIPGLYEGGNGPVSRERADNIRALLYPKPLLPTGRIVREQLPVKGGQIEVRCIWPHADAWNAPTRGTVVYFHGGGWIVGSIDSHEAHCIRMANRIGVVVASVEYRLAPEHKFPTAAEDAFAATRWAHAHKASLGGADQPLGVSGDSAGGNLAAACAIMCRNESIALGAQLLVYPATNLSKIGEKEIRAGYFGDQFATLSTDWRASPVMAPSLAGIAPAVVAVGAHDFLYQDNLAYCRALQAAGVPFRLLQWDNLNHGFASFTRISQASEAATLQAYDAFGDLLSA
jgi:acetyl esterase